MASALHTILGSFYSRIHSFAEPLKFECLNAFTDLPLIKLDGDNIHFLNNDENGNTFYDIKLQNDFPEFVEYMKNKNITEYFRMTEKDPELLQLWGTNYRRKIDPDYWVKRMEESIYYTYNTRTKCVIIPDLRFKNEYKFIKDRKGIFMRVIRLNPDGTQYLDPERDPQHLSEIDLDDIEADYTYEIPTGAMGQFNYYADEFLNSIL